MNTSPFTAQSPVQEWPGEFFGGSVSLPPMKRDQAEAWLGFLSALRGGSGTFLLGDLLGKTPRGTVKNRPAGVLPLITSGNAGVKVVNLGYTYSNNEPAWLAAGDYVQLCANLHPRVLRR